MRATAPVAATPPAAAKPPRAGILAVLHDQPTLDRVRALIGELRLEEELILEPALDAACQRLRDGGKPRVVIFDLSDAAAPATEIRAIRAAGGGETRIIALGTVNDVGLFRELLAAGAFDYLIKPASRDALAAALEKYVDAARGEAGAGLAEIIAFIGSRGGVGATSAAVATAWLLSERHKESTALVDLDLHFGTVALNLDTDPGSGLCEALEQPARIDALFVDRAMIKLSETLRVLAAEAAVAEMLTVDAGAIDLLLHELRRRFKRVVVDLPRWVTPAQRVVLGAAATVAVVCERSLAGLRDTIRLQALLREHAPQARLMLIDGGAGGERVTIGRSEFEKAVGQGIDVSLPYDVKAATAATNAGRPLPLAAPRSPLVRELDRLAALLSGASERQPRRRFGFPLR
jgi:pilus assembly protein CpaE